MGSDYEDWLSIEDYCTKAFQLNIYKSHDRFDITKKINWISNCVKHYDGFPVKEPVYPDFKCSDQSKRLTIETEIFKLDMERLKTHCNGLLSQLFSIEFKQLMDQQIFEDVRNDIPGFEDAKDKFDFVLAPFLLKR
jgi:hypothetical protein